MALRFKPGQAVICVKVEDPKYTLLLGCVGEVTMLVGENALAVLLGAKHDYLVDFPQLRGEKCPGCGEVHNAPFAMFDYELAPLEDPDADEVTEDKQLNIGLNS